MCLYKHLCLWKNRICLVWVSSKHVTLSSATFQRVSGSTTRRRQRKGPLAINEKDPGTPRTPPLVFLHPTFASIRFGPPAFPLT